MDQPNIPEPPPVIVSPVVAATAETPPTPATPWGFWATLGWSLLIALGYVLVQGVAAFVMALAGLVGKAGAIPSAKEFEVSGLAIAVATILSTPVAVCLCLLFASLRRGIPVRDYLGLGWPTTTTCARWCLAFLAMVLAADAVTSALGRPIIPEFMVETYRSAKLLPLLWIALIVGAPLSEEFFFRGFLFSGLQHSFAGPWGTVVLTAALWAVIHVQYDVYGMGMIFLQGLLLGCARLATGSVWLCVALHGLTNFVATVETAAYVSFLNT